MCLVFKGCQVPPANPVRQPQVDVPSLPRSGVSSSCRSGALRSLPCRGSGICRSSSGITGNRFTAETQPQSCRTCGRHLYKSTPLALVGLNGMIFQFQEDTGDYQASLALCEAFLFVFVFHQPPSTLRFPYIFRHLQ